jgi:phosphoribosylaminoimidazole-succinocarboxamide synthase
MKALFETQYHFPRQTGFYRGKVRDVYSIGDDILVMIASDRISAFDVVLPKPIPYKGQVLNEVANYMLDATKDIVSNWKLLSPHPHVTIGRKCTPFPVEMVIRGYLAGHAWRTYQSGKRVLCGVTLPEDLKENDPLPQPIITPTTKAAVGHDEDISSEEIISKGLVSEEHYHQLEMKTHALYRRGQALAAERGLILVDTKYEFGLHNNEILLMDEIHTPDSSRYFYLDKYDERQLKGEQQKQLSKEFVRQWLIENNFMGKEGQVVPEMTDSKIQSISERYIELFEHLTGLKFTPADYDNISNTMERLITEAIGKLN